MEGGPAYLHFNATNMVTIGIMGIISFAVFGAISRWWMNRQSAQGN